VTLRGKAVAKLVSVVPVKQPGAKADPAIGMWADREDMKDVERWVRQLRKPRYMR
jgi:hypothetical protein